MDATDGFHVDDLREPVGDESEELGQETNGDAGTWTVDEKKVGSKMGR